MEEKFIQLNETIINIDDISTIKYCESTQIEITMKSSNKVLVFEGDTRGETFLELRKLLVPAKNKFFL